MANGLWSAKFAVRWTAALLGSITCVQAQPATLLREVRYWSSVDTTRIAIETSKEVTFTHGEVDNPKRVFIDLVDVTPRESFKGLAYTIPVDDGLVKRIRVAPNRASVTRVVLDLEGAVEISTGQLVNPPRIVIDVRRPAAVLPAGPGALVSQQQQQQPPQPQQLSPEEVKATAAPPVAAKTTVLAEAGKQTSRAAKAAAAPPTQTAPPPAQQQQHQKAEAALAGKPEPSVSAAANALVPIPVTPPPAAEGRSAEAARLVTPSLTRALGLKLRRVVLDAGHGGVDPGSDGPTGLVEKELLLDITLRLGKLLEERSGIEVLYTRKDDTYVDLHQRAPFANRAKADLFLSIHANTAPARSVVGAETYYLNRGESKEDIAVATRENATSDKSIFELGDLVKQIVAYDKRDESRQFASHIQAATHALSLKTYGRVVNRGVRHAPFVVLIGATMPAALVEVGFISNTREEALLKKDDHRQKMAEALYKGIISYSQSLSHFAMAQAED